MEKAANAAGFKAIGFEPKKPVKDVGAPRKKFSETNVVTQETVDTFRTALNSGIINTIMMATPADRPIISDGIAYIPMHTAS